GVSVEWANDHPARRRAKEGLESLERRMTRRRMRAEMPLEPRKVFRESVEEDIFFAIEATVERAHRDVRHRGDFSKTHRFEAAMLRERSHRIDDRPHVTTSLFCP